MESVCGLISKEHKPYQLAAIETAQTELNTAWTAASEDMYKAAADAGQAQPGAGEAGPEAHAEGNVDNVTDVDFEDVK